MSLRDSFFRTDLYKLTMGQVVTNLFPDISVTYEFIDRDKRSYPPNLVYLLAQRVEKMADRVPEPEIINFLSEKSLFLKKPYLAFLSGYRFDPSEVKIIYGSDLPVIRAKGAWWRTIYWETPILAEVCEIFNELEGVDLDERWVREQAAQKAKILKTHGIPWVDFGARRARCAKVHEMVFEEALAYPQEAPGEGGLVGTSCIYLGAKHKVKVMGTMAHEEFSVLGAVYGVQSATRMVLDAWVSEYQGSLGIALPDTFTTEVFLRDFDSLHARQFDGLRHDSGDPIGFTDKVIAHYQKLGIDPMSKTIVFSDGLNIPRALEIADYCRGKIKFSFGIGTNFTNDVRTKSGKTPKPLNIVMKAISAQKEGHNEVHAVKLSDTPGKWTGDERGIMHARYVLGLD